MCEPITIMAGAALAGSAISGVGMLQQGQAANEAAQYNVALGEIAVQDALERADIEKQLLGQQFLKEKATGRAQTGSSGIRIGTGSTLDWENDLTETYISDKATIDLNAAKEISGIRNQQTLDTAQGQSAARAGQIGAAGSLLSGAGKAGSMMYTPGG
jgi:hypothetical protein